MTRKLISIPGAAAFLAVSMIITILLLTAVSAYGGDGAENDVSEADVIEDTSVTPAPEPTYEPEPVPAPESEPVPDKPELVTEAVYDYSSPVPSCAAVDDDFFSDAAFIGNSIMDGFGMYSGLKTADFYAATNMSTLNITTSNSITLRSGASGTILQGLAQQQYGKVFILLGINEMSSRSESFKEWYRAILEKVMDIQPGADIYIMGITSVSRDKESGSSVFTRANIEGYNAVLQELAEEYEVYYLDTFNWLCDDEGFMPDGSTWDGVHPQVPYYKLWLSELRQHVVGAWPTRDRSFHLIDNVAAPEGGSVD
jgi:lysophospholipase L1-like esterase